MCILLYLKLTWCSGISQISGQLEGVTSAMGICAFCYMLNLFSVVVLHRAIVNWRREALAYVHSSLCETYSMQWYYIDLLPIGWGCTSTLGICAFCYMCNLFSVGVLHRSMVNQRRGALVYVHSSICETYLMQLYSIDLLSIGGGVHLHWVYVNSAICETYLVQWYSIHLWSIGGGGLGIYAFCYM